MKNLRLPKRVLGVAVLAAAAVAAALTASASSHAAAASHAMSPALGKISVHPEMVKLGGTPGSTVHFSCQSRPIDGSQGLKCYQPSQIQQAYGFSSLLSKGVNGAGETIVIVDAFANPYIQQDLATQDAEFGLPAANFQIIQPQGVPAYDPNNGDMVGWAGEETLDVLWAHAMAPGAKIILDEAKSDYDTDLYAAEKYAVDNQLGDVMSQSFGENENCVDPTVFQKWQNLLQQATNQGWTIFASTGDSGSSQFTCDGSSLALTPGFPAVDPNVTAVGGTTLDASDPVGNYLGETAWTEGTNGVTCNPPDTDDVNCSGGGFSAIFGRPSWQRSLVKGGEPHPGRGVPDVSYNAAVNGGVITVCSACDGGTPAFFLFGGTSAGSPQWAALAADADQVAGHDIGGINQSLYQLAQSPPKYAADFNDVTTGNNDVADLGGAGYNAGAGWDAVTGLGSPKAASLVPALAKKG